MNMASLGMLINWPRDGWRSDALLKLVEARWSIDSVEKNYHLIPNLGETHAAPNWDWLQAFHRWNCHMFTILWDDTEYSVYIYVYIYNYIYTPDFEWIYYPKNLIPTFLAERFWRRYVFSVPGPVRDISSSRTAWGHAAKWPPWWRQPGRDLGCHKAKDGTSVDTWG